MVIRKFSDWLKGDNLNSKYLQTIIIIIIAVFLFIPKTVGASSDVCEIEKEDFCNTEESLGESKTENIDENCDKLIYFFYSLDCPHCRLEKKFLDKLKKDYSQIELKEYEVKYNSDNKKLFFNKLEELNKSYKGVPTTIVGDQIIYGYASDELSGTEIKNQILDLYCIDEEQDEKSVNVPFWGNIKIKNLSIPVLTVILGLIDGFNPCAMWALVALITILLATKDRKKIKLIGSVFLLSSWIIYYFFIAFYLNTFLLLSFTDIVRYIIGFIALIVGVVYIRDFITYKPGVCKVTSQKQQKSIMGRMKKLTESKSTLLIILGIIALAFSVNLVEMVCSIGLPVIFSEILVVSGISLLEKYLYLAFYNTLYMLDDIVIFIIAATTLKYVNLSSKYEKWMKLIGGVLIIVLGVILVLRPDLLSL